VAYTVTSVAVVVCLLAVTGKVARAVAFVTLVSGWTSRASPGASSSSSHDRRALPGKVAHATAFVTLGSRHDAGKM